MNKSTFTTFALAAALAFGGLALASVTASAAAVGHGGGKSGGGGSPNSPGGGGGPDDTPLAALIQYECPPTIAATACNPHKVVRRPVVKVVERCDNWDYPRIILPSGAIVVDYNAEKVRYCGNEAR